MAGFSMKNKVSCQGLINLTLKVTMYGQHTAGYDQYLWKDIYNIAYPCYMFKYNQYY